MEIAQALEHFDRMLTVAGYDIEKPDPLTAWRVFKEFAAVPVNCADDGLLFQVGIYDDLTGESRFHLDFTRQFSREEDGEYVGMEQLHCTLYYAPTDALRPLESNLWSFDFPTREAFFAQVEAMPEFQVPTRDHQPLRGALDQEEV